MKETTQMMPTVQHRGTRQTLRFERQLPHSPEKVWRALTQNAELARWSPAEIRGPREQGVRLGAVFAERPTTERQAEATLEHSWGGEILRWELEPREGHTLLTFTYTCADESKAARDASGWEVCLDSFERRISGAEGDVTTA